jgi:hypothetical protein
VTHAAVLSRLHAERPHSPLAQHLLASRAPWRPNTPARTRTSPHAHPATAAGAVHGARARVHGSHPGVPLHQQRQVARPGRRHLSSGSSSSSGRQHRGSIASRRSADRGPQQARGVAAAASVALGCRVGHVRVSLGAEGRSAASPSAAGVAVVCECCSGWAAQASAGVCVPRVACRA